MIEVDDFKAFDANEVAEMLDLKYRTVTRYIQAGKIRARKIGKKYFVTERDVRAFILDRLAFMALQEHFANSFRRKTIKMRDFEPTREKTTNI